MNNVCEVQPSQIVPWVTYWGTPNPPQQASNRNHVLECSANKLNQAIRSDANVIRNDQQFPYAIGKYTIIQNDKAGNRPLFDPQLPAEDPNQDQQQQPHHHSSRNRH